MTASTAHDTKTTEALRHMANRLRIDSIRATTAAGSGHPSTCLSAAEIMAVLFFKVMRYDPKNPENPTADRFVLSKGHAAPILYAAWAEAGLFPLERLLTLRQIDSDLEGHPTPRLPFVDVATGSLGQGLGAGVGLALNSKFLDKTNYRTYVLLGDGESAEGSVIEAAQMAGYYKLNNLCAIIDANRLGQSQATAFEHDLKSYKDRFEAYGWASAAVDGHDVEQLLDAFERAERTKDQPFVIVARTFKGKGVSFAEDQGNWHGKPFDKEQAETAIQEITAAGIEVPEGALPIQHPGRPETPTVDTAKPANPDYKMGDKIATREAYGAALIRIGSADSRVVALDADTKNSTFADKFMKEFPDRFFECFIAEQNMISVAAGLAACGNVPFASTFAVFLGRGFDQVRMAGISRSNIKLCGSHVGVSIGEDGPSQMGLEDLALFRTIPEGVVFYPSDAVSAERAVGLAARYQGFAYIRTSRPKTPVIYRNDEAFEIGKLKVVRQSGRDHLTIATGGITLFEALAAADQLEKDGIRLRIVDLFTIKPIDREGLLRSAEATNGRILTVEDHYPEGGIGEAVAAAVAEHGVRVHRLAVTEIPRSGPPEVLVAKYGIDSNAIAAKVRQLVKS